jgi:hypothetical protein
MDLIDWFGLFANSLWILGCALALSALSYASWQASQGGEKLGARLAMPGSRRALCISGLLFCIGLAMLSATTIEMILWILLGVVFGVGLFGSFAGWERGEHSG